MLSYIIRRILYSIPVLVATSFLIFTFVSITGDPLGRLRTNPAITREELHSIEHSKRLDRPVVVRYGYWIRDAVTKKFGTTLFGSQKIWPELKRVMWHTVQVMMSAIILSVIFGFGVGGMSTLLW